MLLLLGLLPSLLLAFCVLRLLGVGDLDGDGFADFLAGAPVGVTGSGYVRVFSGIDGSVITLLRPGDRGFRASAIAAGTRVAPRTVT